MHGGEDANAHWQVNDDGYWWRIDRSGSDIEAEVEGCSAIWSALPGMEVILGSGPVGGPHALHCGHLEVRPLRVSPLGVRLQGCALSLGLTFMRSPVHFHGSATHRPHDTIRLVVVWQAMLRSYADMPRIAVDVGASGGSSAYGLGLVERAFRTHLS
jgi:hypothetical protein